MKELVTDKLFAKKARIEKLEMVDKATGEIYCTWIENGEWQKVKSSCDDLADVQNSFLNSGEAADEPAPEPEPETVCSAEHLDLCTSQELCQGAGYWYNEVCNPQPQVLACVPDWQCGEWQSAPDTVACGQTFSQTRTCNDGCGDEKTEPQEAIGTQDCQPQ